MKESKKTMLVIAVTLLLAAALFVGAGAAGTTNSASGSGSGEGTEITYWHEVTAVQGTDYEVSEPTETVPKVVNVYNEKGLGWVASELMKLQYPSVYTGESAFKNDTGITVQFDAGKTYDMGAHNWVPLSDRQYTITPGVGGAPTTAKPSDPAVPIKALSGAKFIGAEGTVIKDLKIINTLEYTGADGRGQNNNYYAGFVGDIATGNGVTFKDLTFTGLKIEPDKTYLASEADPKGYNMIGGLVGGTSKNVTIENVTINGINGDNSKICGSSKVGAFVGYVWSTAEVKLTNCKASNTTVQGIDSVGELIGFVIGENVPVPAVDDSTKNNTNVTISWDVYPEFSAANIDKEMLAVVDVNGKVWDLWTDKNQTAISTNLPEPETVIGIIKGTLAADGKSLTSPVIRVTDAGLFNYDRSARDNTKMPLTTQVKIYDMTTAAPVTVNSTPVAEYIAEIDGTKYYTITDALNAVTAGKTIKLLDDLVLFPNAALDINLDGTDFKLDLGGHTLWGRLNIKSATVEIDNGTIISNYVDNSQHAGENLTAQALNVYGAASADGKAGKLTIGSKLTVEAELNPVVLFGQTGTSHSGYNAAIDVYGTVRATATASQVAGAAHTEGAIFVSGELGATAGGEQYSDDPTATNIVTLYDGCIVEAAAVPALVLNGAATTTIVGGEITGYDGISMKRGVLNVHENSVAVIKATGEKPAGDVVSQDGAGAEKSGSAITISSTYNADTHICISTPLKVELAGGEFVSQKNHAVYVAHSVNGQQTKALFTRGVTLSISGGKFTGAAGADALSVQTKESGEATYSDSQFISGGVFSTEPAAAYLAPDYVWDKATKEVVKKIPEAKKDVDPTKKEAELTSIDAQRVDKIIIGDVTDASVTKFGYKKATGEVVTDGVRQTLAAVYIVPLKDDTTPITTLSSEVTLAIDVKVEGLTPEEINNLAVYHGNEDGTWNELKIIEKSPETVSTITLTVKTKNFSPFAVVVKTPSSAPSKSSTPQGSSVWLTEPTAQPKVTPTPTPTPGAAETPSVKPVNPTETPAKTPAPFLGIIAGLGAAAVVFGLRRK